MELSTINYKFNNLPEAQELATLFEQKSPSFTKHLHDGLSVTCDVEFEKVAPHQNGAVHRVEVTLLVDGTLYRAEATEDSFEKAIDEVRQELSSELRRAKDKQATLEKQGARQLKEKMLNEHT